MGSFKRDGQNSRPNRRRGDKGQRRRSDLPRIESLESRTLLTGWKPTNNNLADPRNGPMANEGSMLVNLYQTYLKDGGNASSLQSQYPLLILRGNDVDITVNGTGNFNTFLTSMTNVGMTVAASSAKYDMAVGLVPISSLPTIAELPQTIDAAPVSMRPANFEGEANNEGDAALKADVARSTFNLTGKGTTIGVISTSVNQLNGGLADSVKTGDLPAGSGTGGSTVNVIQDNQLGAAAATDEGRAMLENIHDIAPGAGLAFATGETLNGSLGFQNNILALANAGSNIINDDLGSASLAPDPFFQDGLVAQGINTVVAGGATYFSAAGNTANQGYLSNFRGVTATSVGSLGSGTYQNFNPGSGAAVTQLPITVTGTANGGAAEIVFQFDQPFGTEEPVGGPGPTSEVDFYVLDSGGNVVATGNNNNVAINAPWQEVNITADGSYTVVMKVISGASPNHVEFINNNENVNVVVSQQFGLGASAGGTYYPTNYGHSAAANAIGVGAVPWWAPAPFLNTNPLNSEPFSSFGPAISVFNPDGSAKAAPQLLQTPVISGPDGGNTSFFPPGGIIDTSNPPFPGEPATATNLSQNLPSFFGTSSATPNVTAVAALMLQRNPNLTPTQIRAALISSAQPLNGAAQGTWNMQGGYGLVNAVNAINAVSQLTVLSTNPANNSTVTTAPTQIVVQFSKPVTIGSLSASDLVFTSLPAGIANLVVGAPVGLDSATTPTRVAFPITFSVKTGQTGNGTFAFKVQGPVVATDGNKLVAYTGKYTVADTSSPKVSNVTVNGRVITVQFSEPVSPSTITPANLYVTLTRNGVVTTNLNNDPRFKITYNPITFQVTLDYTGLNQVQMPTGVYVLNVLDAVTILVGNKLDGAFSGVFPSGNGHPPSNFVDGLGNFVLSAPVITSFQLVPASDSGIKGDGNTNIQAPTFIGQVFAQFPGTLSGLTVLAEFNSLHGGALKLNTLNGRGFTGNYEVLATTNANGSFTFTAPFLPEGYTQVRLVVIGQADSPPLPGLSSAFNSAFRIDNTAPQVLAATLAAGEARFFATGTGLLPPRRSPRSPPSRSMSRTRSTRRAGRLPPRSRSTTPRSIRPRRAISATTHCSIQRPARMNRGSSRPQPLLRRHRTSSLDRTGQPSISRTLAESI